MPGRIRASDLPPSVRAKLVGRVYASGPPRREPGRASEPAVFPKASVAL